MIYDRESMKRYGEAVVEAARKAHKESYGGLYRADPSDLDNAADRFEEKLKEELQKLEDTL